MSALWQPADDCFPVPTVGATICHGNQVKTHDVTKHIITENSVRLGLCNCSYSDSFLISPRGQRLLTQLSGATALLNNAS